MSHRTMRGRVLRAGEHAGPRHPELEPAHVEPVPTSARRTPGAFGRAWRWLTAPGTPDALDVDEPGTAAGDVDPLGDADLTARLLDGIHPGTPPVTDPTPTRRVVLPTEQDLAAFAAADTLVNGSARAALDEVESEGDVYASDVWSVLVPAPETRAERDATALPRRMPASAGETVEHRQADRWAAELPPNVRAWTERDRRTHAHHVAADLAQRIEDIESSTVDRHGDIVIRIYSPSTAAMLRAVDAASRCVEELRTLPHWRVDEYRTSGIVRACRVEIIGHPAGGAR